MQTNKNSFEHFKQVNRKKQVNCEEFFSNFKKTFPNFRDFRFWDITTNSGEIICARGQACLEHEFYGNIYFFSFVEGTYEVENT